MMEQLPPHLNDLFEAVWFQLEMHSESVDPHEMGMMLVGIGGGLVGGSIKKVPIGDRKKVIAGLKKIFDLAIKDGMKN